MHKPVQRVLGLPLAFEEAHAQTRLLFCLTVQTFSTSVYIYIYFTPTPFYILAERTSTKQLQTYLTLITLVPNYYIKDEIMSQCYESNILAVHCTLCT